MSDQLLHDDILSWLKSHASSHLNAIRRASERNRKNFDCLKEGE